MEDELRDSENLIEKQEIQEDRRQREVVKSARQNVKLINMEMKNMDKELSKMIK